jgi:hypothetical protein
MSGYLIAHPYQQAIAELLPELVTRSGNGTVLSALPGANYPATVSSCKAPQADEDVIKNLEVLSHYGGVLPGAKWALGSTGGVSNQDLSLASPWLGVLATSLFNKQECSSNFDCANGSACVNARCAQQFSPLTDRWDRFQPMEYRSEDNRKYSLYAGRSPRGHLHYALVWAAVTSHPCNPYGPLSPGEPLQYPELLYRGVAGALADLMVVTEDENLVGTNGSLSDPYPGYAGFALENTIPVFHLASPHLLSGMPDTIKGETLGLGVYKAWRTGLERMVQRHYYDYLTSTGNQTAHHLVSFMSFALGVQEPSDRAFYDATARRWAGRLFESIRPAGYLIENDAVCTSYIGISTNMMGRYLGLTRTSEAGTDVKAEEAIAKIFGFFNHTVSVEPDGGSVPGFNFSHRIGRGFDTLQYNGAKVMADAIPEVGVWSRSTPAKIPALRTSLQSLAVSFDANASNIPLVSFPWTPDRATHYSSAFLGGYVYPAEEEESFVRNFGDEYIAVKRPSYFAGIFVGKPKGGWGVLELKIRENYRNPTTEKKLNEGGVSVEDLAPETGASISAYNYNPYLGGGLSLFTTPAYGSAVAGTTWSALAQHGLVAWQGGKRYWNDYYSTQFLLDQEQDALTVSGSIETLPFVYSRNYSFLEDRLSMTLTIQATQSISLEKFAEIIPVPTCTRANCNGAIKNRKLRGAFLDVTGGASPSNGQVVTAQKVQVLDQNSKGVTFEFTSAVPLSLQRHGLRHLYYDDEFQVGRIEVQLPTTWSAGQVYTLSYSLIPTP